MALLTARPDALVAFHDFWTGLKVYGEILQFFDVVARAGSLAVLAQRPALDQARIKRLLRHYMNDPT